MKFNKHATNAAAALQVAILLAMAAHPADAADAMGYNKILVPAKSDVTVSVPFTQVAAGAFTVSAVTGSGVTVSNPLTADAYAPVNGNARYYARLTSGAGAGLWSSISANTASEFTLAEPNVLSKASAGDTFTVYPHQTLATLFPASYEGIAFITAGDAGTNSAATSVLFKDAAAVGTDKSAAMVCTYYGQYGWLNGDGAPAGDAVLTPGTFVQVRNSDAGALEVVVSGDVPDTRQAAILDTRAAGNDLYLANPFPVDVRLDQLGLEDWAASDDAATFKGQLLLYDNVATGWDKSATTVCYYLTGYGWLDGDGFDANGLVIPAGMGMVLRDSSGVAGHGVWTVNKPR